jgi:hypothetical protein
LKARKENTKDRIYKYQNCASSEYATGMILVPNNLLKLSWNSEEGILEVRNFRFFSLYLGVHTGYVIYVYFVYFVLDSQVDIIFFTHYSLFFQNYYI